VKRGAHGHEDDCQQNPEQLGGVTRLFAVGHVRANEVRFSGGVHKAAAKLLSLAMACVGQFDWDQGFALLMTMAGGWQPVAAGSLDEDGANGALPLATSHRSDVDSQ